MQWSDHRSSARVDIGILPGQTCRDGVLVHLHGLVELGDLALHLGQPRLRRGELCRGVVEPAARLAQVIGDRRGLPLRGVGATGRGGEFLLELVRPRRPGRGESNAVGVWAFANAAPAAARLRGGKFAPGRFSELATPSSRAG